MPPRDHNRQHRQLGRSVARTEFGHILQAIEKLPSKYAKRSCLRSLRTMCAKQAEEYLTDQEIKRRRKDRIEAQSQDGG